MIICLYIEVMDDDDMEALEETLQVRNYPFYNATHVDPHIPEAAGVLEFIEDKLEGK